MNYTAEEVRAIAKRLHDDITVADGDALMASDMLTAYAERIKADEESAVGYVATDNKIVFYVEDGWSKEVPPGTKLFTHPPAQAAQVEDEDMDAQLTVMIEHLTSIVESQAAEPVAQGEASRGRCIACGRATRADKLEAALQEKSP